MDVLGGLASLADGLADIGRDDVAEGIEVPECETGVTVDLAHERVDERRHDGGDRAKHEGAQDYSVHASDSRSS